MPEDEDGKVGQASCLSLNDRQDAYPTNLCTSKIFPKPFADQFNRAS